MAHAPTRYITIFIRCLFLMFKRIQHILIKYLYKKKKCPNWCFFWMVNTRAFLYII